MATNRPKSHLGPICSHNSQISECYQRRRTELSTLGNAIRFIECSLRIVRYVPARGWFLFVETHWQPATMDTMLLLARQSLDDFLERTSNLAEEESDLYKRIITHIDKSQSLSRLQALLRFVRTFPELILPYSELDADPYLLNLRNGTLDLRSGELLPHNPEHYLTRLLPYDYTPEATAPIWDAFLDQLTGSDPALQRYLQRAIGCTLFGASEESTCFVLTGPGRRAHQLLLSTLHQLMGSYTAHTLSLQQRGLTPTLLTSRLLTLSGSTFPKKVDPTLLFALLNHEPLTLTKASTELIFEPRCTIWLSASELPRLSDDFASLQEYLQPIPLSLALSSHEAAQLSVQLRQVLPAILNWAIEGFQLWYTEAPPIEPACIQQATVAFCEEQNPLARFLAQACTPEPEQSLPAQELYQAYVTWARASGERPLSASRFGFRVLASGLQCTGQDSSRFYQGLKLLSPIASTQTEGSQQLDLAG